MSTLPALAPAWQVSRWLNTQAPPDLQALRGRVVVLHAFQMLCPGCVALALPQMRRVREAYAPADVAVLGLHTVFEHHAVMGAEALEVFLHEYRVDHPVGIDRHADGQEVPLTMQAYGFRGTPSLVLLDRQGRLRLNHFGHIEDLQLGTMIGQLMSEGEAALAGTAGASDQVEGDCLSTLQCERRERSV